MDTDELPIYRRAWAVLVIAVLVLMCLSFNNTDASVDCPKYRPSCRWWPSVRGYFWQKNVVPGLVSVRSTLTPSPIRTYGGAVFYAPGVMESVARYKKLSLENYVDGVALMSCSDLGQTVWIKPLEGPMAGVWEGPFLVIDCAARHDMYGVVVINKEVVEVGFETAVRWGMAKRISSRLGYKSLRAIIPAEVSKMPPGQAMEACPAPVYYPDWWEEEVLEFTTSSRNRSAYELREAIADNKVMLKWLRECLMIGHGYPFTIRGLMGVFR